jgi:hypothetical protein
VCIVYKQQYIVGVYKHIGLLQVNRVRVRDVRRGSRWKNMVLFLEFGVGIM